MVEYNGIIYTFSKEFDFNRVERKDSGYIYHLFSTNLKIHYKCEGDYAIMVEKLISFRLFNTNSLSIKAKTNMNQINRGEVDKSWKTLFYQLHSFGFLGIVSSSYNHRQEDWNVLDDTNFYEIQGQYYIVNLKYKSAKKLKKSEYDSIKDCNFHNISEVLIEKLFLDRFIDNQKRVANSPCNKLLSLYVVLSYKCNLKCTYCFEADKSYNTKGIIEDKTITSVSKYINKLSRNKSVELILYGGEPLLGLHRRYIQQIFKENLKRESISFKIITNATNVDMFIDEIMSINHKLTCCVVTIDGTKKIHDSRRIRADGSGTFDEIITSINILLRLNVSVCLRVNIDNSNYNCIEQLICDLDHLIFHKEKVKVEFHQIQDRLNNEFSPISIEKLYNLFNKLYNKTKFDIHFGNPIIEFFNQFSEYNAPVNHSNYCSAENVRVIDYNGEVYSCNEAMGKEHFCLGNLRRELNNNVNELKDDMNLKECSECKLFTACGGICRLSNYYGTYDNKSKFCNEINNIIKRFLIDHYE